MLLTPRRLVLRGFNAQPHDTATRADRPCAIRRPRILTPASHNTATMYWTRSSKVIERQSVILIGMRRIADEWTNRVAARRGDFYQLTLDTRALHAWEGSTKLRRSRS